MRSALDLLAFSQIDLVQTAILVLQQVFPYQSVTLEHKSFKILVTTYFPKQTALRVVVISSVLLTQRVE